MFGSNAAGDIEGLIRGEGCVAARIPNGAVAFVSNILGRPSKIAHLMMAQHRQLPATEAVSAD